MGTEEEVFTRLEESAMSKTFVFLAAIVFVLTFVHATPVFYDTKPGFNSTEEDPPKKEQLESSGPIHHGMVDAGEEGLGTPTEPTVVEDKPDAGEEYDAVSIHDAPKFKSSGPILHNGMVD